MLQSHFLKVTGLVVGFAGILTLSGCTSTTPVSHVEPVPATFPSEMVTQNMPPQEPTDGSLWPGDSKKNLLFSDNKARNVNDIVTITVSEVAKASGDGATKTAGSSSNSYGLNAFFGIKPKSNNTVLGTIGTGSGGMLGTNSTNSYDGSGTTSKNASLTTTISAVVVEVFPNGNLRIKGSRVIVVNRDTQVLTIEGIIRPEDISFDNSIKSSQIAEAKIAYTGVGVVADKQGPGIGQHIMDVIWPF